MARCAAILVASAVGLAAVACGQQVSVNDPVCIDHDQGPLRNVAGNQYCRDRYGPGSNCLGMKSYCCSGYMSCDCNFRQSRTEVCSQSVSQVSRHICTGRGVWECSPGSTTTQPPTTDSPTTGLPTTATPTTVPTTSLPTISPSPAPTATPTLDPCRVHGCSRDCEEMEIPTGGIRQCGWDSNVNRCVTGRVTTFSERQALHEAYVGACSHRSAAPVTAHPTRSPTSTLTEPPTGELPPQPLVGSPDGTNMIVRSSVDGDVWINGVSFNTMAREHAEMKAELQQLREFVEAVATTLENSPRK